MKDFLYRNYKSCFLILLLFNFTLRVIIFYNTNLFFISDFKAHLLAIEKISNDGLIRLASGNFLFAISYIGYFFKYVLGNSDYFFLFNCLIGTAASAIITIMVYAVTFNRIASILTLLILTFYTEFMVFSSVFYTAIIMIFLLSLLTSLFLKYYSSVKVTVNLICLLLIILVILCSFLFKQELLFLPIFMIAAAFLMRKNRSFLRKTLVLSVSLSLATITFYQSGILTKEEPATLANDFVFFGHTDYGGDGGEGAFIYPENRERYYEAWLNYKNINGLTKTDVSDRNRFQLAEIRKFITHHPAEWIKLQFTKFFRTYGVVPESTSFKILYTGLLKDKIWPTSIIIVAPVAIIVLLFILLFDFQSLRKLVNAATSNQQPASSNRQPGAGNKYSGPKTQDHYINRKGFLYIYVTLFIYYMIATIFFGQYQERYRLPVIALFIIPTLSYLIATFNKRQCFNRNYLLRRVFIIIIFLTTWVFQADRAIGNKQRLNNAIELIEIE